MTIQRSITGLILPAMRPPSTPPASAPAAITIAADHTT